MWSPDGSKIAYTTGGQGPEEITILNSDGSGEARKFPTTSDIFKTVSDWPREGLVVNPIHGRNSIDLVLAPYPTGSVMPLVVTEFSEAGGKVSPDGYWMAYLSNEAGSNDLYIQSFPTPGHKIRVSSGGASRVWWMPGGELCYLNGDGSRMMSVKLTPNGADLQVGEPRELFSFPQGVMSTDVSHDGRRMLVATSREGAQLRKMRLILNWTGMLGR